MNLFEPIQTLFSSTGTSSGLLEFVTALGLFFVLSWLICVAAAFCRVRQVQFTVGMLAMGCAVLLGFLFSGLCRVMLPDLAASFTPGGLFLISAVAGALCSSVPLIMFFWDVSYTRGLMVVGGAVTLMLAALVTLHLFFHPVETIPARFSVPLFQEHQIGLE